MKQWTIVGLTLMGGSVVGVGCGGGGMAAPSAEGDVAKNTSALSTPTLATNTQFFVPPPQPGAVQQVANLLKAKDLLNAARVADMAVTPQAVWFESGSPTDVQKSVKQTMAQAALEKRVPVLVSYNIPFRDCAQYSAGGALDTDSYEAWIDGFAAGIGKGQAVVILEPDSLGLIPYATTVWGSADTSCQPTMSDGVTPATGASSDARYAQLAYALNSIQTKAPNALVYLDGTHSAWLGVSEATARLMKAGIQQAAGFYLNVSNYRLDSDLINYGTWISSCIALTVNGISSGAVPSWWLPSWGCPGQYILDAAGNYVPDFSAANVTSINQSYATLLASLVVPTTHFIIDSSRNGQGPLNLAPYSAAPYNQTGSIDQPGTVIYGLNAGNWCNPFGAGLGLRPTANTGVALLDAYLWVKTPGESDGSCDSAGGARAWDYTVYNPWKLSGSAETLFDPLWGVNDPAAGVWFPQQTLQLVQLANPKLL